MRAAILNSYGGVENFTISNDVPKPEVGKNQVLVEVKVCSLNPIDLRTREGLLKSIIKIKKPIVLGYDMSGVVIETGDGVTKFKSGDRVYGMVDQSIKPSKSGFAKPGTYAQYVVTREDTLSLIPDNMDFKDISSVPMCALTAFQALEIIGDIEEGDHILINGASGGVGVFAVQLAKLKGAVVTTTSSSKHTESLLNLGADRVIDYREMGIFTSREKFDIIYDVVANKSLYKAKKILTPKGRYISNIAPLYIFIFPFLRKFRFLKRHSYVWVESDSDHLNRISKLLADKKIKPVVDRFFSLDEVGTAHQYLEEGSPFGKICMTI